MKFFAAILAFFLALTTIVAHPISEQDFSYPEDIAGRLFKRQTTNIPVTGVRGSVHPRLEIRWMQTNRPNAYTLTLLAMRRFMQQNPASQLSYYGISGIHGVPRVSWGGVNQCASCGGADGYCLHDSLLFLGWHRAYLALFEQQLKMIVDIVANEYRDNRRADMLGAARTWRLPYWDWAAAPPASRPQALPTAFTDVTVTLNGPTGSVRMINPLYRHDFRRWQDLAYSPFTSWTFTQRYPSSNAANAGSQNSRASAAMSNVRRQLQDQVFQLFATCRDFAAMASDSSASGSVRCANSLEGIHNIVHTAVGGAPNGATSGGHLTYLPLASFDPIFWIHHANVDRLWAIWQTRYPNSWSGRQAAPSVTWAKPRGEWQDLGSWLQPFRRQDGSFWTTDATRNWRTMGYTYPDFTSGRTINSIINSLYGPSNNQAAGWSKRDTIPTKHLYRRQNGTIDDALEEVAGVIGETLADPVTAINGSLFQYVANVEYPRYALEGTYQIFLFNGPPATEVPKDWILAQNQFGYIGVLAQDGMSDMGLVASSSVPITTPLSESVDTGLLPDLSEAVVARYLSTNLVWRIAGPDGQSVDPESLEGFKVSIYGSTAPRPRSLDDFPEWSEFVPLAEATEEKEGGATNATIDTTGTEA